MFIKKAYIRGGNMDRNEVTYQYFFRAISHQLKLIGDEKLSKYDTTNGN